MQDLYEKILARITPLEVYGEFVQLRRSGKSYVGLCPFHAEDTPSFHVDPEKGLFHCFGCKAGGNLVTFIAQIHRISRGEALRWLAQRAGIPPEEMEDRRGTSRLVALLQMAAEFYHRALVERPPIVRYLEGRGIRMGTLTAFQVGYAPGGTHLAHLLLSRGFSRHDLLESGLFVERRGQLVERMAGRIVFPIRSSSGKIVAFGGRVVDKTASPKYINFENTPIFEKQRTLFGFWEGRRVMEERGVALVVEGYMDVLAVHEAGIGGVVAPLGTYLTPMQAALLQRVVGAVRLVFDGDDAGRQAARRTAEILLREGVEVDVVLLPEGKDPADLLVEQGPEGLQQALSRKVSFWDFYTGGKRGLQGMQTALHLLRDVRRPVVQEVLIAQLAAYTGVDPEAIRKELRTSRTPVRPVRVSGHPSRFLPYRVAALACLDTEGSFRQAFLEVFAVARPWIQEDPPMRLLVEAMEHPGSLPDGEDVDEILGRARFERIPEDEEDRWALLQRALRVYLQRRYHETRDEALHRLLHRMLREEIHGDDQEEENPAEA